MYEYKCTVDRVVDGDTIDVTLDLGFSVLYKTRVELYGTLKAHQNPELAIKMKKLEVNVSYVLKNGYRRC